MTMRFRNQALGGVALELGERIEFGVQKVCGGPTSWVELGDPLVAMLAAVEGLAARRDASRTVQGVETQLGSGQVASDHEVVASQLAQFGQDARRLEHDLFE
jgi:hypothetical protein